MRPNKRSTLQYERSLEDFRDQVNCLRTQLQQAESEREVWLKRDRERELSQQEVLALRQGKQDLNLQFFLAMTFSLIGSCLISSYPKKDDPIWFAVGWCMVLMSVVFSLLQRVIGEIVRKKWPQLLA